MAEEIINRVAQSDLITIDLEDFYPEGERVVFDLKDWLYEGYVLREKEFRTKASEHNWEKYHDKFVALQCSSDAIIPAWAYMLISSKLQPFAKTISIGDLDQLENVIFNELISKMDLSHLQGKPIIVKGCSSKAIPENAYIWLTNKLQGIARSVMYGEACSSVPIYKRKK